MSRPKVSVCVPAYRQPSYVRRALVSVLAQKFTDYEVVVTDDSPDDATERVVTQFSGEGKVRYFRNTERLGVPQNWNRAVREASGEYIKLLHHDDWLADETCLGTFVELLETDRRADFAFSASRAYRGDERFLFEHKPTDAQLSRLRANPAILFLGNFVGAPSATIYRRTVRHEYDPKLKWAVDIDFYIRVLQGNPHFQFSPRPLVCVTADAPHQVTKLCAGNRAVEVYEWVYLYRRVSENRPLSLARLNYVRKILGAHGITSQRDLADCGVDFPLPASVRAIVAWQRIFGWSRR